MSVVMVTIEGRHFNMARLLDFFWSYGRLYLRFVGCSVPEIILDPDRKYYEKVCDSCRVRPVPQPWEGESDAEI